MSLDVRPGRQPRIYVAGSSDELDRAAEAIAAVRAEGWELTHDWVSVIRGVGHANPGAAKRETRAQWALADIDGVYRADAVWLLSPLKGAARGAFVELGYVLALKREVPRSDGRRIVVSGPIVSIFCAVADVEVETDLGGLAKLQEWFG